MLLLLLILLLLCSSGFEPQRLDCFQNSIRINFSLSKPSIPDTRQLGCFIIVTLLHINLFLDMATQCWLMRCFEVMLIAFHHRHQRFVIVFNS